MGLTICVGAVDVVTCCHRLTICVILPSQIAMARAMRAQHDQPMLKDVATQLVMNVVRGGGVQEAHTHCCREGGGLRCSRKM